MKSRCERGIHDYREAYDEVPRDLELGRLRLSGEGVKEMRTLFVTRKLRAIYCRRCGKTIPLPPKEGQ